MGKYQILVLPVLWLILIVLGIKFNKNGKDEPALSKEQSLSLRGICALEIILGHLSIYSGSELLYPLQKADILFVGLFFLMSGYGTAYSFKEKENYTRLFVIRKMLRLFIPAYIAFGLNKLHLNILYPNPTHLKEFLSPVYFIKDINWFIYELMAMYIITYICIKLGDIQKSQVFIWLSATAFMIVAFILKLPEPWYGCTLCFPLGISYFIYQEKLNEIIRKKPVLYAIASVFLLGAFTGLYMLLNSKVPAAAMISRNAASVIFCVIAVITLSYFTVVNKVTKWLGDISFELYLYHIPVIGLAVHYIVNPLLCGLVSVICSVILAFVMKQICRFVRIY